MKTLLAGIAIWLVAFVVPTMLAYQHRDWVWAMSTISFAGCAIGASIVVAGIFRVRQHR